MSEPSPTPAVITYQVAIADLHAHLCADLGYFYAGNDVMAGCAQLLAAIDGHDARADDYRARQRALLARFLPGHADVTAQYSALLEQLFQ